MTENWKIPEDAVVIYRLVRPSEKPVRRTLTLYLEEFYPESFFDGCTIKQVIEKLNEIDKKFSGRDIHFKVATYVDGSEIGIYETRPQTDEEYNLDIEQYKIWEDNRKKLEKEAKEYLSLKEKQLQSNI
jgi:hypothetical protein